VLLHHVGAGLAHVPVELDARRLEYPARGLGQLGAGAVTGNEDDAVGHGGDCMYAFARAAAVVTVPS
jgi:hypothetical protein